MRKGFLVLALAICAVGCGPSSNSTELSLYHEDGRAKPKVAFLPVVDSSEASLPWSLSQEFTEGIQNRFLQHKNLFLLHDYNVMRLKKEESAWLREIGDAAEFVVFVELAEHNLVPKTSESLFNIKNAPSYQLNMSVRVKVVDVRQDQHKVILQEMFTENYTIPWQLSGIDYDKTSWGKTSFFISPLGLAHAGLIRKISGQIEDYILLAKTR